MALINLTTSPRGLSNKDNATAVEGSITTGNVLSNDVLIGSVYAINFAGTNYTVPAGGSLSLAGAFGTLNISSNGSYSYNAYDSLRQGQTGTDTFTYSGALLGLLPGAPLVGSSATLSFAVTGANDGPVLSALASQPLAVAELGNAAAQNLAPITGSFNVLDKDVGDTLTASVVGSPVVKLNGVAATAPAALTATGALTLTGATSNGGNTTVGYKYDPAAANLDYLSAGDSLTITYTIRVSDGVASSGTQTLTITITGTNDAPTIVAAQTTDAGAVTEITDNAAGENTATLGASGSIKFNDVDLGDTHTATAAAQATGYRGNFVLGAVNQAGDSVDWTFSVSDGALDDLAAGQVLIQRYDLSVSDNRGGSIVQVVTVTLTGTNDAAVITGTNSANLIETNLAQSTGGALTATDVDGSAAFVVQTNAAGSNGYGSFSINAAGVWTYTMNSAHDEFVAGTDYTDSLTVATADGTTQVLTVTIRGTNDAPVILAFDAAFDAAETLTENNATLSTSGRVVFTDVDSGDTPEATVVESSLSASGVTLSAEQQTDIQNAFSIADAATGTWSFSLASPYYLPEGSTVTATYTVRVTDDNGDFVDQPVVITLTGTNDTAVIGTPNNASVTEDLNPDASGNLTATGSIGITDLDQNEASFQITVTPVGTVLGSLDLQADGSYTYSVANSAVQFLGATEVATDTFTVTALDGTTRNVSFTINGANDAPVVDAAAGALAYTENDAATVIDPSITVSDVDSLTLIGATVSITGNFAGAQDVLGFVNQNGIEGGYDAATGVLSLSGSASVAAYQSALRSVTYLNTSENPSTLPRTVSFEVNDGSAASELDTRTITVTAVDDAPVAVNDSATVTEDSGANAIALLANDTDVDGGPQTIASITSASNGTVAITGDGTGLSYTPNLNFFGSDSFSYTLNGGSVASVNVTVSAVADAPVANADTITTAEDTPVSIPVLTNDTDADNLTPPANAGLMIKPGSVMVSDPAHGTAAINGNNIDFTPAENFHGVASITYIATDGALDSDPATVMVTVTSVNDAPVAVADSYTAEEDIKLTVNAADGVLKNDSDVEGDSLSAVLVSTTTRGTLALAADGSFTYTGGADFNGSDSFTYKLNDGTEDGNTVTVTLTVNGVNDRPVLAQPAAIGYADTAGDDNFDPAIGTLSASDVDGPALVYGISGVTPVNGVATLTGTYGTLAVTTATGAYTYTPNDAAIEARKTDTSENFTVTVSDGSLSDSRTLTVNITGANDTPRINANDPAHDVSETLTEGNATLSTGGRVVFSDVDTGDTAAATFFASSVSASGVTLSAQQQAAIQNAFSVTNAATGTWSFSLASPDYLPAGSTVTATYTVRVTDGDGAFADQPVVITIKGSNDAPTLTANSFTASVAGNVQFSIIDPDQGDTLSLVDPFTPAPTVTPTGDGANSNASFTLLAEAQAIASSYHVNVSDSLAATGNFASIFLGTAGLDANTTTNLPSALYGFGGNDSLTGGSAADFIFGGADNDSLSGAAGVDTLDGGAGDDTFLFATFAEMITGNALVDVIVGGEGVDTLVFNGGATGGRNSSVELALGRASGVEVVAAGQATSANILLRVSDSTIAAGVRTVTLAADTDAAGSNQISAATITDPSINLRLIGSAGNDGISGGAGADTLEGGSGDDTFSFAFATQLFASATSGLTDSIDGGAGTDTITVSTNSGPLLITADNDWARASGVETLQTSGRFDSTNQNSITLNASAFAAGLRTVRLGDTGVLETVDASRQTDASIALTLTGGFGSEMLIGGAGNDSLNGGDSNDTLIGGLGGDALNGGGTGIELFIIASGHSPYTAGSAAPGAGVDTISGFRTADRIDFGSIIGTASNYSETSGAVADFAAAAAAANMAFGTAGRLYHFASDGTNGYLFHNRVATGNSLGAGDDLVVLQGVNAASFSEANIAGTAAPVNAAPVLAQPAAIGYTDSAADDSFTNTASSLSATDANGDPVTYGISGVTPVSGVATLVGSFGTLAVTVATGAYTYTPNDAAIEAAKTSTSDTFTVTASDGSLSDSKTLTVNIAGVNDTPEAGNIVLGSPSISYTATDRDNDTLTLQIARNDSGDLVDSFGAANVSASGANFTFTPTVGDERIGVLGVSDGAASAPIVNLALLGATNDDFVATNPADPSVYFRAFSPTLAQAVFGFDGDDSIRTAQFNDLLDGGAGKDTLVSGEGADTLVGGLGVDVLTSGLGADRIVLKPGDSPFGFNSGGTLTATSQIMADTVTDFTVGTSTAPIDRIDLGGVAASSGNFAQLNVASFNSNIFATVTNNAFSRGRIYVSVRANDDINNRYLLHDANGNGMLDAADTIVRLSTGGGNIGAANITGTNVAPVIGNIDLTTTGLVRYVASDADALSLRLRDNASGALTPQTATGPVNGFFEYAPAQVIFAPAVGGVLEVVDPGNLTGKIINVYRGSGGADSSNTASTSFDPTLRFAMFGYGGNDILTGGTGIDLLNGGPGADELRGGDGNDILFGDSADTLIDGGVGTQDDLYVVDTFVQSNDAALVNVERILTPFSGGSITVDLTGQTEGFTINVENQGTGTHSVIGGGGDDVINGGFRADTLNGGGGNDSINGGDGDDLLRGGAGNDSLSGLTGADTFVGGAGADTFNGIGAGGVDGEDRFLFGPGDSPYLPGASTPSGSDLINNYVGSDRMSFGGPVGVETGAGQNYSEGSVASLNAAIAAANAAFANAGRVYHFALETGTGTGYVFYNGNGNNALDSGDSLVVLGGFNSLGTVGGITFVDTVI